MIVLPNLSFQLMGILFKVHNELGPSLLEKYYQRAIERELTIQNVTFKREFPVELLYEGKSIGRYFLDFIISDLIILEIKAQEQYSPKFFKQAFSYLKQVHAPLAIIANFRSSQLQYKRIVNPEFKTVNLSERDII